jgi:uncharacterized NAD-dependent epimerase/dehydratase family protein
MVILTEGHSNPHTAKTASCLLRYCPSDVVAVLDSSNRGLTTDQLLQVGGDIPVVGSLSEATGANTLLIGIAPPGGKIPEPWRAIILEAIKRGMKIVSGLHDHLCNDPEFVAEAKKHGVELVDVRKNECLRILTVGHDCSVGKMVTSVELTLELKRLEHDAKFVATGQTGIMVEGDGCAIDSVVADFISGATEKLVLENQHHEILVIEGQGSLIHPSYSSVTLGLLHGSSPHGLIMCFEVGREVVTGVSHVQIPPLAKMIELNETMASVFQPCRVIGISMNSRRVTADEAARLADQLSDQFQIPVCDVIRDGPGPLADAVLQLQQQRTVL